MRDSSARRQIAAIRPSPRIIQLHLCLPWDTLLGMAMVTPLEVIQHDVFREWLLDLRDDKARARIAVRIRRLELGNPGKVKPVGGGVSEMKIDYGPGYRLYFIAMGTKTVILLCGGDKATQDRDIADAKAMVPAVRKEMGNDKG
jgi:putative addiction module killer protein